MGFPAERLESIYRNDMHQVVKFFNARHQNHYRVYNLCSERKYNHDHFQGNVAEFPFEDHQAPQFDLIFKFCQDLDQWLAKDPKNVAGIHCKAGKGRTGVMICCYLMWSKMYAKAYDAIRYYAMMRTRNKKGVTIPSQIRYILYYEKSLEKGWTLDTFPVADKYITKIKLLTVPQFNVFGGCEPWFRISCLDKSIEPYESLKKGEKPKPYKNEAYIEFNLENGVYVKGDILIEFYNKTMLNKSEKMFQLWINAAFFDANGVMLVDKFMLDKACKDKKHKNFSRDFHIEIHSRHPQYQEQERRNASQIDLSMQGDVRLVSGTNLMPPGAAPSAGNQSVLGQPASAQAPPPPVSQQSFGQKYQYPPQQQQ
jgi:phosphatidylinositol-3,4,5-trisphosphate 3-phosphatase/dual-specificity protein phosphatase PTEN